MDLADEEKRQFIGQHLRYGVDTLQPALNNHFSRITLVNKAKTERLTIDSGLRFHNLLFSALGHPRHPEVGYLPHPGTTRRHSSLCSPSMPR